MNKTCFDRLSFRFSQGLAATVLVAGVAGFASTAQAETVSSAAALLEVPSASAIAPGQSLADQSLVDQSLPEQSLFVTEGFSPEAIVAQTTQPTPLNSPNQLPPPGQPVPGQPSEPGRTGAPVTQPTPGSTPGTQPTPLDSPNQLPPPGQPVPGQPTQPSPTVPTTPPPSTTPTTPPPTTRPAPPPRGQSGIEPGRSTATGPSYIGIGGNIGLGTGDTAVGDGSFAVFSKVGLTQNLSLRPSVLFSDSLTFLVPVTLDFIPLITPATRNVGEVVGLTVSPYAGVGAAISTGDDNASVDFLVTGGVDVPISENFTANAQLNITFVDNTAVGLLLGVGYNF